MVIGVHFQPGVEKCAAAKCRIDERPCEHGEQRSDRACTAGDSSVHGGAQPCDCRLVAGRKRCADELVLGAKVLIEGALGDTGFLGDRVDPGRIDAIGLCQPRGSLEQPRTRWRRRPRLNHASQYTDRLTTGILTGMYTWVAE
ncbi:MAG: hypothetical protein QOC63_4732 [Mycobacterium sp.]|nr:hypothetical protein [Mycobacterium sp.]